MRASLAGSLAVAALVAATLVGCTPPDGPQPTPTPTSTQAAAPTEEELLADARATFDGYLAAGQQVAESQSYSSAPLEEWASPVIATGNVATLQELLDAGFRVTGSPVVVAFRAQNPGEFDALHVVADACIDTESQHYTNLDGNVIDPPGQPRYVALTLTFERSRPDDRILLTKHEGWAGAGGSPCDGL